MEFINYIASTVSSHDAHFKNIRNKLNNLENNFNAVKTSLKDFRTELSQLKQDNLTLKNELIHVHKKLALIENTSTSPSQHNTLDFLTELKDRISREKNIILFNVPDSEYEVESVSLATGCDLLKDLSLSNINIIRAKRIGKFGLRPRPILLELESQSNVFEVFKSKFKLRSINRWNQVSITEDRTTYQQAVIKQLRMDLGKKKNPGTTVGSSNRPKELHILLKKTKFLLQG